MQDLPIVHGRSIPASALSWTATTSEGPGGQNVNRVQTRVVLRCELGAAGLPEPVVVRMRADSPRWFEGADVIVLTCQQYRSQRRNLAEARAKLAAWIERCWKAPKRRRATRPGRGAVERRLRSKKQKSVSKRRRRWRPD
ncbi:MAG TPA: aminoacyl-tRNA hydrolase [Myxococcales bacterium]|nr:aminoacyl-tRNA hydrolase [Myxococcales bacterium]